MSYIYKNLKIKIVSIACIYTHIIFLMNFSSTTRKKNFYLLKRMKLKRITEKNGDLEIK